jgi:hypothetical protein
MEPENKAPRLPPPDPDLSDPWPGISTKKLWLWTLAALIAQAAAAVVLLLFGR